MGSLSALKNGLALGVVVYFSLPLISYIFCQKKPFRPNFDTQYVRSGHDSFGFFAASRNLAHEQIFAKINCTY